MDDAEALVAELREPQLALVGICAGAWVSARVAATRRNRLTVLVGPNYWRTRPMEPDAYARVVLETGGVEPRVAGLKAFVRDSIPNWLWRLSTPSQLFNNPATLLRATRAVAAVSIALLMPPEDAATFDNNRGIGCREAPALARCRRSRSGLRVGRPRPARRGPAGTRAGRHRLAARRDHACARHACAGGNGAMTSGSRAAHGTTVGLFGVSMVLNGAISLVTIPIVTGIAGGIALGLDGDRAGDRGEFRRHRDLRVGSDRTRHCRGHAPRGARVACILDSLFARIVLLAPVLLVQLAVTIAIVPAPEARRLRGRYRHDARRRVGELVLHRRGPSRSVPHARYRSARRRAPSPEPRCWPPRGDLLLFALAQLAGALVALIASAVVILRRGAARLSGRGSAWPGRRQPQRAAARHRRDRGHGRLHPGGPGNRRGRPARGAPRVRAGRPAGKVRRDGGVAAAADVPGLGARSRRSGTDSPHSDRRRRDGRRSRRSTGIVYTLLLPTAADLLAHGQIGYQPAAAIAFGLIATLYVGSSFVSMVALMAGRVRLVALAAVVGVPVTLLVLLAVDGYWPAGSRGMGGRGRQSRHGGLAIPGSALAPATGADDGVNPIA